MVKNCLDNSPEERSVTEILMEQVRSIRENLEEENSTVDGDKFECSGFGSGIGVKTNANQSE